MYRPTLGLAVAVAMGVVAGCAGGRPDPAPVSTTSARPPTSTGSPSPPTQQAGVLPAELVGAWSSSGPTTEIAYRFLADGRYRLIEILSQPRPAGIFEFRRQQDGTVRTSADQLQLRPTTSVTSRTDPDDPAGDYADRPAAADDRGYRWQISGTALVLTDADGLTLRLERQS